jgi:hypothetical protein
MFTDVIVDAEVDKKGNKTLGLSNTRKCPGF